MQTHKYKQISEATKPFPTDLVPSGEGKICVCGNSFCSADSAVNNYLVISDKVHIHDIFNVDDSRNMTCRIFFLDTTPTDGNEPLCDCKLYYTGEEDQLFPVSSVRKTFKTFSLVSYRMLYDFLMLEMVDGTSESGYINAYNRRRKMLFGDQGKECPKHIWLTAVADFEAALNFDEVQGYSCEKCPSEFSPGDGQDEVHTGDGISEGTQVDLVPEEVMMSTKDEPQGNKDQNVSLNYTMCVSD